MTADKHSYIVITGASSGIGRAAALAFAARGYGVILIARRAERLTAVRREILAEDPARSVELRAADLTSAEACAALYAELRAYPLHAWINNAGFGDYNAVGNADWEKLRRMLRLNVEALAFFSARFARDFRDAEGAQLINVSSCGGYTIVPDAVPYCASKFFAAAFTEGLARELLAGGARLRAKVFAPAAVETEFGRVANGVANYDYAVRFPRRYTAAQAAACLLALYDSDRTVGWVDRETFAFHLEPPRFAYAGDSAHNQRP